jgi:hypothetical protein
MMKHSLSYMVNMLCSCLLLIACCFLSSCKKFVQVPPPLNQVVSTTVFTADATASSALTGIYSEMMSNFNQFCTGNTTLYAGMSADELSYRFTGYQQEFEKNEITQASHGIMAIYFWNSPYKFIYAANLCMEGLNASTALTPSVKNALLGEAKFIRAFCYFYLVNYFGDVPLVTSPSYQQNAALPRSPAASVYQQVIADLKEAQTLLPSAYSSSDRTRPNKWAATALLARAYLFTKNWPAAEEQATTVINANAYALNTNLSNVFVKGSTETIWQLLPVNPVWNTWEGRDILPSSTAASAAPQYFIIPALLNAFEPGDARQTAWIASKTVGPTTFYYPYKYKVYGNSAPQTEYYVVLRLAEQYLIRAEARAQQNNLPGAVSDINTIRSRASLPGTTATDQSSLLSAIEQERRIELMFEWGHRWFDLKRTGRANAVLGALKPLTWQPTDTLWPIPVSQLNANPALTQNPGY